MDTLVLNANYDVMKIVKWQKAITWIFLGKVDVIEEYGEYVNSPSIKLKKPAVVRFNRMIKAKYKVPRFSREHIYARDRYTCLYCGVKLTYSQLTLDHIIPRSRGGKSTWTNCASCCIGCNVRKANKTPKEANMELLLQPYHPNPNEAFLLSLRAKLDNAPEIWKNYCVSLMKLL